MILISKNKTKRKLIFAGVVLCLGMVIVPVIVSAAYDYTPMEAIPGSEGNISTLPSFIYGIYRFGIWTVGIAAMLMIIIGGFMYMTAAGNTSKTGTAKTIITDAIYGLVVALAAYLLLFVINPDLVNVNISMAPAQTGGNIPGSVNGTPTTPGGNGFNQGGGSTLSTNKAYQKACSSGSGAANFSNAGSDSSLKFSSAVNNLNFSNTSGADPCILKSMAQIESGGKPNQVSPAGCCGLMQLSPATATKLNGGNTVTCNDLINNNNLSIQLAAKYVSQNQNSAGVNGAKDKTSAIFAGYNSGYSTSPTGSASGKKGSLAQSSDCPGSEAFECCTNPGGLAESIGYAYNGEGLYTKCKSGS